ncbi:MAG: STAS domain-containing protein [Betaproteobacteria bacterium]
MIGPRGHDAPTTGGFALDAGGGRWLGTGALTSVNAGGVLEAATALPLPSDGVVDCGGLGAVDSAAVAVLLALKRRAGEAGRPLRFVNLPPALAALASLYDVEGILASH